MIEFFLQIQPTPLVPLPGEDLGMRQSMKLYG